MLSEQDIIKEQGGHFYRIISKQVDILQQSTYIKLWDSRGFLVEMCLFSNKIRLLALISLQEQLNFGQHKMYLQAGWYIECLKMIKPAGSKGYKT